MDVELDPLDDQEENERVESKGGVMGVCEYGKTIIILNGYNMLSGLDRG